MPGMIGAFGALSPTNAPSAAPSAAMEFLSVLPNDQPSPIMVSMLRTLMGAQENVAISIWVPRTHPSVRFSSRLRFYNQRFLALCDTHSFGGGNFGEVYPTSVLCYSPATAANIQTHLSRCVVVVDGLHIGEERGHVPCFSHISKLGRLTVVDLEAHAVRMANNLVAFIMMERIRAPEVPLPLQQPPPSPKPPSTATGLPRSVSAASLLEKRGEDDECEAPRAHGMEGGFKATQRQDGEWVWVASPNRLHCGNKTEENFLCMQCGTKETSQKRYDRDIPFQIQKLIDFILDAARKVPTLCVTAVDSSGSALCAAHLWIA